MRNAGRLKLGYYPLPIDEARNFRSLLVSSAPYAAIDPCVGDGTALIEITKDTGACVAGIELDADRAAAAATKGISTVHGSAFECRVLAETCSLLYLNPPYDSEFGPHSNKRMELVFLEHCYRWVISEGGNAGGHSNPQTHSTHRRGGETDRGPRLPPDRRSAGGVCRLVGWHEDVRRDGPELWLRGMPVCNRPAEQP